MLLMSHADIAAAINLAPDEVYVSEEEVASVITMEQVSAVYTDYRSRFNVRVWDRASNIGAGPPEHFFTNRSDEFGNGPDDYGDGVEPFDVLIVEGEGTILVQSENPLTPGWDRIPAGQGAGVAVEWQQLFGIQHGGPAIVRNVKAAILAARQLPQ